MLKKIFNCLLAICLCCTVLTLSVGHVDAKDSISNYIIAGSGTETDPYVLSSDCPYKEELDNKAREIVQPSITPLIDFSDALTGTKHYGQYNGGVWRYTSGGPDGSYNDALTILGISYGNFDVVELFVDDILSDSTMLARLQSALNDNLIGSALTATLTSLYGGPAATMIGGFFLFAINSASGTDSTIIAQAHREREGILEINYRTSYNGSWYVTSCLDVWHTASSGMAQEPGSYYGTGYYTSK